MQYPIRRQRSVAEPLETRKLFTTFTVSTLNADGPGSLAEAVTQSNDHAGADVIDFSAGAHGSILLSSALEITDSLEVNGPGASALTLVAGGPEGEHRILSITGDDTTIVSIAGLTLTGGDYDYGGSAVNNFSADVTIDSCIITNNFAAAGDGGAVASNGGSLTILESTLANNATGGEGGGGAISIVDGRLRISNSTVSGNTSVGSFGGGGGIALTNADTIIENSTISGNTESDGSGGGIQSSGGTLVIRNSTIANNSATQTSEPERGRGGGIYIFDGEVSLISTIVADNNSASTFGGKDVAISETASAITASHSLIESVDASSLTASSAANLVGQDPKLAPLTNNAGATQTQALFPGSPAINAGSNDANLTSDQRGAGFARVVGAGTDIGAFESDGSTPQAPLTAAVDQSQPPAAAGSSGYEFHVTYSNGAIDSASLDSTDVTVTGPGDTTQQVEYLGVLSQSDTATAARYRLLAPGGTIDAADNGAYNVSLAANAVKDSAGTFIPAGPIGTFALVSGAATSVELAVTSGSLTLPAVGIAGQTVKSRAVVNVSNPGEGIQDAPVALFLSADGTFDANDTRLATSAKPAHLKAGASKAVKLKVASLPAIADGTYQVLAVIDPDNALAESSETNNVIGTGVSIEIQQPRTDLAIDLITFPESLTKGKRASAGGFVQNTGNVPFSQLTTVALVASTDETFSDDDVRLSTVTRLIRIAPTATKDVKFKISVPAELASGSYHLIAVIDPDHQAPDGDPTNNSAATPGTIQLL